MKENRKLERIKAVTFTTVYERKGHVLLGFLGDLTPEGAMVMGEKQIKTNRDLELEIEFRGVAEIPGGRLIIPARVSWSKLDEETKHYHTGFEFLSVSENEKQTIELVMERYRFDLNLPA